MKISKETMAILKNYTQINPSILIQKGSTLRTIDHEQTITSSSAVKEDFPKDFAIYDLPNFLSVVNMFDGAELDFGDDDTNHCMIKYANADTMVRYMYASPDAVEHVKKDIVMPITEINFDISKEQLSTIMKAAITMDLPHILLTPDGDKGIIITATSVDNPSSNTFRIFLPAELSIKDFYVVIDFQKFTNLMEGNYSVGISTKEISHFFNPNIEYWIALNTNSSFEG